NSYLSVFERAGGKFQGTGTRARSTARAVRWFPANPHATRAAKSMPAQGRSLAVLPGAAWSGAAPLGQTPVRERLYPIEFIERFAARSAFKSAPHPLDGGARVVIVEGLLGRAAVPFGRAFRRVPAHEMIGHDGRVARSGMFEPIACEPVAEHSVVV